MASDPSRSSLPFEPKSKRKKEKSNEKPAQTASVPTQPSKSKSTTQQAQGDRSRSSASIPEEISQRMFRRMLLFSGIPVAAGVSLFFVSYFLTVRDIVDLPPYAVLFSTLGCFGLGVLGLSYGALSASWDEGRLGSWFGFDEFRTNFPRLTGAWKNARNSGE
ncbi:DUF3464 domain-containing protein [filamentous cyanobacterium CCP5]|nr:DUF3464 domain-containing protein [filamentous cyanobacterium CCP5]